MIATVQGGAVLTAHAGFARALLIYSAILAVWGFAQWALGRNPSAGYLGALVILEGLAVVLGLVGLALVIGGNRPATVLHYLYGIVAVVALPAAYFLSAGGHERRDSLVFGLATTFLIGVAIRGMMTGGT